MYVTGNCETRPKRPSVVVWICASETSQSTAATPSGTAGDHGGKRCVRDSGAASIGASVSKIGAGDGELGATPDRTPGRHVWRNSSVISASATTDWTTSHASPAP